MELANLSVLLVWGAATALAVALVAFSIDLSRLSGARVEARDATRERVAVGAGAVADAPRDVPPADAAPVNRRFAGIGMSVTWLASALLLVAVVLRGIAAGRAPWANMYEFTVVGAFVAVTVFAVVSTRRDVRFLGAFVTFLGAIFLVTAQTRFFVEAMGVQPALQKYWLVIHVGVAIVATGIFTVAFVTSVLQLLRDARDNGSPVLGSARWGWLDHTPAPAALESLSFRLNAVAFVLWTFTIIGGAIWAEDAWGRYWGWDPKEVWSFIVWVVYAAYLHARTTRGWSGSRAAWFVVAGYASVLFNFTGVNLIFDGKHSYSGL
ncbi:MAG TPA: c-type cytochrome biogenesis protein CcsB [Promicromonospora sp.]|nr:c-type cytochrome biogenesis protein CcsB [Promicromonospora sp.]